MSGLTLTQTLNADLFTVSLFWSLSKLLIFWKRAKWLSGVTLLACEFCFERPRLSRLFDKSILYFDERRFFVPALFIEAYDFSDCFAYRFVLPSVPLAENGDKLLIFYDASEADAIIWLTLFYRKVWNFPAPALWVV